MSIKLIVHKNLISRYLLLLSNLLSYFLLLNIEYINKIKLTLLWILFSFLIFLSNYILSRVSKGDNYIFLIISMLINIGITMVYRINPYQGFKQIMWYILGLMIFFIVYFIFKRYLLWNKLIYLYLSLIYIMFISTLIFGSRIKGALNWIKINGIGFQPSEVVKVLLILFMASFYTTKSKINRLIFVLTVYSFIGFLFLQKDLGSALLLYLVFMTIFYVNERNKKYILYNVFIAMFLGVVSIFSFSHVKIRMISWLNPWGYIDSSGYQITQSLFAIAEGGFLGHGLGEGNPKYIPEVQTDFIFSAIIEELGILIGVSIILLVLLFIYRGIKVTLWQKNKFLRLLALGITSMIGFQSFIIIGGVIKLIPLTGITLPFVSYGGSSLVMSFVSIALLQVASEDIEGDIKDG